MRKFRKVKIIILLVTIGMAMQVILNSQVTAAVSSSQEEQIKKQLEQYTSNIDLNNLTKEDVLKVYDQLSEKYNNEELAGLLSEYEEEIKEQGVNQDLIDTGKEILESTDKESIRNIIDENIDFKTLNKKLEEGYTPKEAITETITETPTDKKVELFAKMLWSNYMFRTFIIITTIVVLVRFVYGTILRWIIYKKAGKHGWAAIIPLYRQIVMYKVCEMSPFLMFIWLIPIIGWMIMFVIAIIKRFKLSKVFGRGVGFGFGLLFLTLIFQSIIAFNSNIKYVGDK